MSSAAVFFGVITRNLILSNPPHQLTSLFLPLLNGENFHRRTIRLEYVSNSLLAELGTPSSVRRYDPNTMRRLELEFVEGEDGELQTEKVVGETARSMVDLIGVEG